MYKENNDTVIMRKEGKVAVVTLNRPARYNAITEEMKWGLLHIFTDIQQDTNIKAVVLTGNGKGFCAGADMGDLQQSGTADPQAIRDNLIMVYGNVVRMIMRSDKPVIAAINGPVAGAGLGFALACDLRIMANHANMRYAFINIGLVPDNGSTWFLTRQVGYSKALEIIIEGEKIPAMAWANKLANMPTVAIGATKRILNFAMNNDLYNTVTRESEEQMPLFATHDHKEGVMAFVTKRKPNFIGK